MLTFNNKILTVSNKGLEVEAGPTPPAPVPPFSTVQIGSTLWSAEDIQIDDNGTGIVQYNIGTVGDSGQSVTLGNTYYYTAAAARRIAAAVAEDYPGWRLPTSSDYQSLFSAVSNSLAALKSTVGWDTDYQGTNTSGFSAYGTSINNGSNVFNKGNDWYGVTYDDYAVRLRGDNTRTPSVDPVSAYDQTFGTAYFQFRLVKDAEGV